LLLGGSFVQMRLGVDDYRLKAAHMSHQTQAISLLPDRGRLSSQIFIAISHILSNVWNPKTRIRNH
jgi:hypothetical protein